MRIKLSQREELHGTIYQLKSVRLIPRLKVSGPESSGYRYH
jgi:hypothetical protein